ncbi:MAG: hypothetical protein JOZ04_00520 [Acidimicrobiia bacterium]|nr:hypothetical protein [Acidimicrobiia bacterium]
MVVEWLNVSGGVDADPDWANLQEEIVRAGHIWVGASAQRIGVMGGPTLVGVQVPGAEAAGKGLRGIDPVRYGGLDHPGDGFSFDIFTQIGRAVRTRRASPTAIAFGSGWARPRRSRLSAWPSCMALAPTTSSGTRRTPTPPSRPVSRYLKIATHCSRSPTPRRSPAAPPPRPHLCSRVRHHGLVGTTVDAPVGLVVAGQVHA